MPLFFCLIFGATATAACRLNLIASGAFTSAKLLNGECDRTEECAGVFFVGAAYAFLFGNAVIGCLYKDLRGSHDSNDGENTEGNVYSCTRGGVYQGAVKIGRESIRKLGYRRRALLTRASTFALYLRSEHQRLHRFHDGNGCI